MKTRIAKRMRLPLIYGVLAGWVVAGVLAMAVIRAWCDTSFVAAVVAVSAVLLLALSPAMRRAATVYSLALRYHRAEYLYDLGNGVEATIAMAAYEKKARRAASAWVRRKLLRSSFGPLPVAFFAMLMGGANVALSLEITVLIGVMVLVAVPVALHTMLYFARRKCYDKFGNIKNA
ncbi:MAG: ABC transporter permease [Prevotella sp.]|nr:ABC transporter permease [Prevotella sp.]